MGGSAAGGFTHGATQRGPDRDVPVARHPVRLAGAARRRPRGFPLVPCVWKSGRGCLGWRGNAPAGGRQARPDLSRDKSGEDRFEALGLGPWRAEESG